MGNILFQNNQPNNGNSVLGMINSLRNQGPSNVLFNQMYQNNPNFKQFADQVRNMSPEQAFRHYGLDINKFRDLNW